MVVRVQLPIDDANPFKQTSLRGLGRVIRFFYDLLVLAVAAAECVKKEAPYQRGYRVALATTSITSNHVATRGGRYIRASSLCPSVRLRYNWLNTR